MRRVVYHLLKRVAQVQRLPLLREAFTHGQGIGVQRYLLGALLEEVVKQAAGGAESLMDTASLEELKTIWVSGIQAAGDKLLANSQLPRLLHAWREWSNENEVRTWCSQAVATDDGLMTFLPHFCSHTRSQTMGDWAVRIQPRLNPAWISKFIDMEAVANRLSILRAAGQVPQTADESVSQYLKEFAMLKDGKDPDAMGAFGD